MRRSRNVAVLAAVGVGIALAACGSSKSTGPSAAALSKTMDSLFRVDSASGSSDRANIEALILLSVSQGATPTKVTVTNDAGGQTMQLLGLAVYDTAGGSVKDSLLYMFAWTGDYATFLATLSSGSAGPDQMPRHRIAVSSQAMTAARSLFRGHGSGAPVVAQAVGNSDAAVFQGTAAADADSITMVPSEAAASGSCAFQHLASVNEFGLDSTALCTPITITESFALHFPSTAGIDASWTHATMSPSQTAHGARLLSAN